MYCANCPNQMMCMDRSADMLKLVKEAISVLSKGRFMEAIENMETLEIKIERMNERIKCQKGK